MKRVEVILSRALDEEFQDRLADNRLRTYTAVRQVIGRGYSDPKMGDDVWPQENKLYVFYADEAQEATLARIVRQLREEFPAEGIAAFSCEAKAL
ncbi:MAG: hypothetical protein LKE40_03750 [Spirochaetia bacterium]|jgi:hypothetical protein|nr:hypothetical protein [Spirochaetia bacterium]